MVVDDSAVVRGMVSRWLEEAGFTICAVAVDGAQALKKQAEAQADVCILDIEMPVMTGLEALPKLMAAQPGLKVIMSSTLTEAGAQVTLKALQLGAADFIAKPSAGLGGAEAFRRELVEKVWQFARRRAPASTAPAPPSAPPRPDRGPVLKRPQALVIASSTGGPPALRQILIDLGAGWRAPILIAQHMPATFTRSLAEMLDKVTPMTVKEAAAGEALRPGAIYVAPGDWHFRVRRGASGAILAALDKSDPINWCRPSADPLFASAAEVWGPGVLGLVLTGMGHDGRDGAQALKTAGAHVIAQDEASSVVWGMPGAVVEAGLADEVLPLRQIGGRLASLFGKVEA